MSTVDPHRLKINMDISEKSAAQTPEEVRRMIKYLYSIDEHIAADIILELCALLEKAEAAMNSPSGKKYVEAITAIQKWKET